MSPQQVLHTLLDGRDLGHEDMASLMHDIMTGQLTPVQIAGILVALRAKGETVGEIAAAAEVMRQLATPVPVADPEHLLDTCGTGGDGAHTFNISTAAAIVAAAAGARVAKHGGRSVSSTCGSADVLEALGVNVNLTPEQVARCVEEIGVGFMFAPNYHSAMRFAAPVRRELGVRTLFNLLGPLTNPAGAKNQLMGVFSKDLVGKLARVLAALGSRHAMVVHAEDGLDEISLGADTFVAELRDGEVLEYRLHPQDFGFDPCSSERLAVHNVDEAVRMMRSVFVGEDGPARDIVCLNAGAALYVAGTVATIEAGVARAEEVIRTGKARAKLEALAALSSRWSSSH